MKEQPIFRSPNAFNVFEHMLMTEKERKELYSQRVDELAEPYTVIDVLKKVYHRDFLDDFKSSVETKPDLLLSLKKSSDEWVMSQYYINSFKIIRPEAVFSLPADNFVVDIYAEVKMKITETEKSGYGMRNVYPVNTGLRLRYCFDLSPCELTCEFIGLVIGEDKGLYSLFPDDIRLDKYLLPVLKGQEDYEKLARMIIKEDMPDYLDSDKSICGIDWLKAMGLSVNSGVFPEDGVMGEYFFSFGTADVYDPETDSVKSEYINPGTVLLNIKACDSRGKINTTATHEGTHHRLCYYFFMMQMAHGKQYTSYLCKRREFQEGRTVKWTPIDIMELQANKLPSYILIQEKPGKKKAEELLKSYGGEISLENIRKLVNDMAEYFGVTKTMARSRLYEFGYREVGGIGQYIKGSRVPSYISRLGRNETYTIDENEAIEEYINNSKFRKILDLGLYEYVEGHYCLRESKYICVDHLGKKHLTSYAREHMDECCLVFEVKYENILSSFVGGVLHKGGVSRKVITYTNKNGGSVVTTEGLKKRREIEKYLAEARLIQKDFNQMTKELMKSKGFTIERLAEQTGLSVETIKNMRNDPETRFTIEAVTAVCIAMHLSSETSKVYIEKSPAKFLDTIDMQLYNYALLEWSDNTVAEVNRKLIECGAKPLTNLIAGLNEEVFAINY